MDFNKQVLQVPLGGKQVVKVSMLTKKKIKLTSNLSTRENRNFVREHYD